MDTRAIHKLTATKQSFTNFRNWPKLADRIRRRTMLTDAILAHAAENH